MCHMELWWPKGLIIVKIIIWEIPARTSKDWNWKHMDPKILHAPGCLLLEEIDEIWTVISKKSEDDENVL
jgi:hypothetical protein